MNERLTKGQRTKQKLLEAAATEFAAHGDAARVSDMVFRLGLTQPAFYRHFETKEHARRQVIDDFRVKLREMVASSLIPHNTPNDTIETLTASALINLLLFLDTHRDAMTVAFIQEADGSQTRSELVHLIEGNIEQEVKSGHFRADIAPRLFAEIFVGIVAQIVRVPMSRPKREKQAREVASLLINGLKA